MKSVLHCLLSLVLTAFAVAAPQANAMSVATVIEEAESPLDMRIDQLVSVLKGEIAYEDYFDDRFLAAVPEAQLKAITASLVAQYGQPLGVTKVDKKSETSAVLLLEFEKAIATINFDVSPVAPNKVYGLVAVGFASKDDSLDKIASDFAALAGSAGYVIEKLNGVGKNELVVSHNGDAQFAIGSTFKLYILAELADQVAAGERKWSDVVPLAHRSFSSSATNRWPKDSPVTLQTLAIQMISVSDNSATDTLLHLLGREAVEKKLATIGHRNPDKMLPFLSTVEAFALKSPANSELRDRYLAASEAMQREIVAKEQAQLGYDHVDQNAFASGPAHIDTIEWFASPYDVANLLDNIRLARNDVMLQVMAVNSGISPTEAEKWNYLGYKGGSEPGVMSMSFLLQSKEGQWFAVSGSWNNPSKELDQTKFVGLMTRLVQITQ